jgi:hypothetical protein
LRNQPKKATVRQPIPRLRAGKKTRDIIIKPFQLSTTWLQAGTVDDDYFIPRKKGIGNKPVHLVRHPPEILS